MKLTKILAIAITSIALMGRGFADPPKDPANKENAEHEEHEAEEAAKHMHDVMKDAQHKLIEAMKKDAHQDAEGQKKLDEIWNQLLKEIGIDPKDPNAPKDPFVYEGSPKDQVQDAKLTAELNKWRAEHGLPPISPII